MPHRSGVAGDPAHQRHSHHSAASSSLAAIFHHNVHKIRRHHHQSLHPFHGPSHMRQWHVAMITVRFIVRLRLAAMKGARFTPTELSYLFRTYFAYAQLPAGLYTEDGIGKLLQHFSQPQPPITLQELLHHVGYDSMDGTNQLSFGQLRMMMLYLKKQHMKFRAIADEEELFCLLPHVDDSGWGKAASASAVHTDDGGEISLVEGTVEKFDEEHRHEVQDHRVDPRVVQSILNQFDLRVISPENFMTGGGGGGAPASPSSTMPPNGMSYNDFLAFLKQRPSSGRSPSSADKAAKRGVAPLNPQDYASGLSSAQTSAAGSPVADDGRYATPIASDGKRPIQDHHVTIMMENGTRDMEPRNINAANRRRSERLQSISLEDFIGMTSGGSNAFHRPSAIASQSLTSAGIGGGVTEEEIAELIGPSDLPFVSDEFIDLKRRVANTCRKAGAHPSRSAELAELEGEVDRLKSKGPWEKVRPSTAPSNKKTTPGGKEGKSGSTTLALVRTKLVNDVKQANRIADSAKGSDPTSPVRRPQSAAISRQPRMAERLPVRQPAKAVTRPQSATLVRQHQPTTRETSPSRAELPRSVANDEESEALRCAGKIVHSRQYQPTSTFAPHVEPHWSHSRPQSAASNRVNHNPSSSGAVVRPSSALAAHRRRKATPFEVLCAAPSFRLSEQQQEHMSLWYQREYQRVMPASTTALDEDGKWDLSPSLIQIATSVKGTLESTSVRALNSLRAHDLRLLDAICTLEEKPLPAAPRPASTLDVVTSTELAAGGGGRASRPASACSRPSSAQGRGHSDGYVQQPPSGFLVR